MSFAPVAVFAYRRPAQFQKMLETLQACEGFEQTPIVIFVDGPRGDEDKPDVMLVREIAASLKHPNVRLVFAEKNRGLRASITAGVTDVVKEFGKVIVIEEDLRLSPVCLQYFNSALDQYSSDERVWSVSGYMYDVPALKSRESALVLPFSHPWGWATWRRAWEKFSPDLPIEEGPALSSKAFRNAFNMSGLADFSKMLVLAKEGFINSWWIRWYYSQFISGGVSIFPPHSYISNGGIGTEGATHGSKFNLHRMLVKPGALATTLVSMPTVLKVDYPELDLIRSSWDASVHRLVNWLGERKRRLKKR